VAVVAIGRNHGILFLQSGLYADHNGFLTDVEVAETADQSHTVELPCFFFETADEQHIFEILHHLFCGCDIGRRFDRLKFRLAR